MLTLIAVDCNSNFEELLLQKTKQQRKKSFRFLLCHKFDSYSKIRFGAFERSPLKPPPCSILSWSQKYGQGMVHRFLFIFLIFSGGSETAFSDPSIAATDFFISYPFVATCSPCVTFSSRE